MQVIAHRCLLDRKKCSMLRTLSCKKSSAVSAAEALALSSYRLTSPFCEAPILSLGSSNDIGRNSGMSTDSDASFAILMNFIFLHVIFMLASAYMLAPRNASRVLREG